MILKLVGCFAIGTWRRQGTVVSGALLLACALGFAPPALGQSDSESPAEASADYRLRYADVRKAILAFKSGKPEAARKLLIEARDSNEEIPPADIMMARLYLSSNQIKEAEASLERVVVEFPQDPEAFVLLGDLAIRGKRPAYAGLAYERADSLLDDYDVIPDRRKNLQIRVQAGLASLAETRKQYDRAVEHLRSWLAIEPKSPVALGSLGRVSFHGGKFDEARRAFERLHSAVETAPPPEISMGRLFADVGKHDEALRDMRMATTKYGSDLRALLTVADWALACGETQLARENTSAALKIDPDSAKARVLSARLARHAGELDVAERTLSQLVSLSPNSVPVTDEFARTLAASDDEKKRKAGLAYAERNYRFQQGRKKSQKAAQVIVTYAWTLVRNDQMARAETVAQTLPDGVSISNENAYLIAEIFAARGKREMASQMLAALLKNSRPFPMRTKAAALLESLSTETSPPRP